MDLRRYFSSFISHFSSPKGFSLIELVLYMGLMSILVGVLGMIFASIVDVQLESESTSSVDQDGRYILSRLIYDVKSATSIVEPGGAGEQTSTMELQIPGNTLNYIYSLDGNGNLQLVNALGTDILNGYDSQLSNLNFQRIGDGDSNDTVRVSFTLTSRTQRPGVGAESREFQTTLTRDYRVGN